MSGFAIAAVAYGCLHWAFPEVRVQKWVAEAEEDGAFIGLEEPKKGGDSGELEAVA